MAIVKFETGKTYYTRSACDHNCVFTVKVLGRTAKTIKALVNGSNVKTLRVSEYHDRSGLDHIEEVKPLGSYSMAPIVSADKVQA